MGKIKGTLLLLLLFISLACNNQEDADIEVGSLSSYDFNNKIQVNTIQDATLYVLEDIEYKFEGVGIDYWQTPEQTYRLKTGDCEDKALLLMYILKNKLGVESHFLLIENIFTQAGHAMLLTNDDDYLLSTEEGNTLPKGWKVLHIITYSEVLWMAYYYHNNVGKYY